jgi:hypothetical protein
MADKVISLRQPSATRDPDADAAARRRGRLGDLIEERRKRQALQQTVATQQDEMRRLTERAELAQQAAFTLYCLFPPAVQDAWRLIGIRSAHDFAAAMLGGMSADQRELVLTVCSAALAPFGERA